jgi:Ribosomal protein S21
MEAAPVSVGSNSRLVWAIAPGRSANRPGRPESRRRDPVLNDASVVVVQPGTSVDDALRVLARQLGRAGTLEAARRRWER